MKIQFITAPPPPSGEAGPLLLLLAFAYALLLPACHKDDGPYVVPPDLTPKPDTLPALTTIGANTFGCKVNGKVWVVKAGDPVPFDPSFQLFASSITEKNGQGGYITVNEFGVGVDQTMSFGLPCRKDTLHTHGKVYTDSKRFGIWLSDNTSHKRYYPDTGIIKDNRLEITHLDTVNNVISGTFSFQLFEGNNYKITNRNNSIIVTDGRFDIRYSN
ncbi:MAG TPA: hypothetical protein PKD78_00695 [Saprospiraceae bacterium]|nr:hypothetical protein [Saprospiraceae bacterium]